MFTCAKLQLYIAFAFCLAGFKECLENLEDNIKVDTTIDPPPMKRYKINTMEELSVFFDLESDAKLIFANGKLCSIKKIVKEKNNSSFFGIKKEKRKYKKNDKKTNK
ncbi:hypothetical protein EDEG_02815 [Edhazardia aedis USNM 41457]|uniref:Uncharacterized protein n=1 Tax=Edhazardia aedis (strain USNM 41457) TaxID=1003232 RepID=J9D5H7_EDHAE|nr:hypothetical protein EDEG_02815 [Edhazardia aedis USNM 41457]|eukprot:EJW02789.1 hypothetical protein EDEG_02815 [Edhazardia aedis USNM 41457]